MAHSDDTRERLHAHAQSGNEYVELHQDMQRRSVQERMRLPMPHVLNPMTENQKKYYKYYVPSALSRTVRWIKHQRKWSVEEYENGVAYIGGILKVDYRTRSVVVLKTGEIHIIRPYTSMAQCKVILNRWLLEDKRARKQRDDDEGRKLQPFLL